MPRKMRENWSLIQPGNSNRSIDSREKPAWCWCMISLRRLTWSTEKITVSNCPSATHPHRLHLTKRCSLNWWKTQLQKMDASNGFWLTQSNTAQHGHTFGKLSSSTEISQERIPLLTMFTPCVPKATQWSKTRVAHLNAQNAGQLACLGVADWMNIFPPTRWDQEAS